MKGIIIFIWRTWFVFWTGMGIVIFAPFFYIALLFDKSLASFCVAARMWSRFIFLISGVSTKSVIEQPLEKGKTYIICANHTSFIDIPAMYLAVPGEITFIGKESMTKIPLFGYFYRRVVILINRKSKKDSYRAFQDASKQATNGRCVVIFPEGGIPKDNGDRLHRFKSGAFRIAVDQELEIVPITFPDNIKIFPGKLTEGYPGKLRMHVHRPVSNPDPEELKKEVYAIIDNKLQEFGR